jgi:hypothetical protein
VAIALVTLLSDDFHAVALLAVGVLLATAFALIG